MVKTKASPKTDPKARQALRYARQVYDQAENWLAFHNALFGIGGKIGALFPTQSERTAFVKTEEYRQIMEMLHKLQQAGKDLPQPPADASGNFLVRAPRSLHAALLAEAEAEGVSLNQLCVAKLSAQLRSVVK